MDPLEQIRQVLLRGLALPGQAVTALGQKALPVAEFLTPTAYQPQPAPAVVEGQTPGKVGGGEQTEVQKLIQTGLENIGPGKVAAAGTIGTMGLLKQALQKSLEKEKLVTAHTLRMMKEYGLSGDYSKFTEKAAQEIINQEHMKQMKQVAEKSVGLHGGTPQSDDEFAKVIAKYGKSPEQIQQAENNEAWLKEMLDKATEHYGLEKKTKAANVTVSKGMNMDAGWKGAALDAIAPDVPGEAPLLFPWRAYLHGYNVPAYHGTASREDFNRFMFAPGDIGAHFGTPRAATERLAVKAYGDNPLRVYPVLLKPGKSLEMPDLGSWGTANMIDELVKQYEKKKLPPGLIPDVDTKNTLLDKASESGLVGVRDFLTGKGYSSIKYINNVEHPGSQSWIMFQPDPASPAHVTGIKSPWAKFKDLRSSDILASLAALGLAGTEFAKPKEKIPDNL